MVSIFSEHFFNWTEQLKNTSHEIYWFDIFDSRTHVEKIGFVGQFTGWRYRIDYPGRYYVKKNLPELHRKLNLINERSLVHVFEKKINDFQPDVVHSFGMHLACFPIYKTMMSLSKIKWIYSSWGSDLYHYQDNETQVKLIKRVLSRVDCIFTDCQRDYQVARKLGFSGEMLGVFPGRGGFDFRETDKFFIPLDSRKTIVIKGYEGKHGRCIHVLKAIRNLKHELNNFDIVVFGANKEVKEFVRQTSLNKWDNLKVHGLIPHDEVLRILGKSLIYIGNSMSDGIPNTLLEAVIMGVFPIQTDPGGASSEIIINGKNGLLIKNPEDIEEIKTLCHRALKDKTIRANGVQYNLNKIKPNLERDFIKNKVLSKYHQIKDQL